MFDVFLTDTVTLHKQDGRTFENIRANVQSETIFIPDDSLPIEEGDTIIRKLPNELIERYTVIERGFHQTFHTIKAHYQVKVRKESAINSNSPASIIITGNNSRVNLNSSDNSINTLNVNQTGVFTEICKVIEQSELKQSEKDTLLGCVKEMHEASGTKNFLTRYQKFIATAANHSSIFASLAPLLPTLSQMLG